MFPGENEWPLRHGGELFYRRLDGAMMAVRIESAPSPTPGTPEVLFEGPYAGGSSLRVNYDLSPGGERFLMIKPTSITTEEISAQGQMVLVLNWFEELKRLVPTQ